jgi:transposase
MAAGRSKDTYLAARYRCIASRRGSLKAVVAIERTVLTTIWQMANTGALYDDPGPDFYIRLRPGRAKQRAVKQLTNMGYRVTG